MMEMENAGGLPVILPADEPAPSPAVDLAPRAGIMERLTGRALTLEELRAADLAMTADAELKARLRLPGSEPEDAAACRQLDALMDENARRRSVAWSQPQDHDAAYRARLLAVLRGAILLVGQDPARGPQSDIGAASMNVGQVWADFVLPGMEATQAWRRHVAWGRPLPEELSR